MIFSFHESNVLIIIDNNTEVVNKQFSSVYPQKKIKNPENSLFQF